MIPKVKKSIKKFILNESGSVSKKRILSVGSIALVALGASIPFDSEAYEVYFTSIAQNEICTHGQYEFHSADCGVDGVLRVKGNLNTLYEDTCVHEHCSHTDEPWGGHGSCNCNCNVELSPIYPDHVNAISLAQSEDEMGIVATHENDLPLVSEGPYHASSRCQNGNAHGSGSGPDGDNSYGWGPPIQQ